MSDNLVANTMSEAEREEEKQETMESYVWIRTADGSIREVEREVAMIWPTIGREMKSGLGSSKNNPISLSSRAKSHYLSLVIDYCRFHLVPHSYQEHMTFDQNLLQMDAKGLFELLNIAIHLQVGSLLKITKEAAAEKISNKSAEEIWHMLNLTDGVPEAAKLKLQQYSNYETRARLLEKYRSNQKKSMIKQIGYLKDWVTGVKPRQHEDTREIDDLVSFINGGDGDTQGVKTSKNKKKHKKRKGQKEQKETFSSSASSSIEASTSKIIIKQHGEDINASDSANHSGFTADTSKGSRVESFNFNEYDFDDDLDPVLMAKNDRIVEAFARSLNLDMAEILFE